jgi:SRSO17 transposase
MDKSPAIPHAPSEPLPELDEFLKPFQALFRRRESQTAMERYLTGLLTEHPAKNCDTLAEIVPGTTEQQLQGLLTQMIWDEAALNQRRVQIMRTLKTEGDGVLIIDDTGFAKQGLHSVGVARQYSGTLGKVANCQITVNCHYAERTLAWPVATRLYLPKAWGAEALRRQAAQVPDAVTFHTKPAIGLDLIDQANAWGVRHACVVADAGYGDDPVFLNGLEARGERYVVAVRANFSVVVSRQAAAEIERVDGVLTRLPRWQWQTLRWREGSQGWLRAKFVSMRCWRVDGDGTRHVGWLIGQRPTRGEGEWKYFWSNFPLNTALEKMVEYTHRRYWVEQFHEEAKSLLGWDQYQGRLWHGFHRHAALIMLTYSFLVWLELREREQTQRRGRPRGLFSPSARSSSPIVGGDPSPGREASVNSGLTRVHSLASILDLTK